MTTINAQTIINEVMDAYAVAPSEHNEHQNNYACYWPKFAPWGFEDLNESTSEYPTSAENAYRDLIYDLMTDATSEINDLFMVPTKIKFQTSERGFHTVRNIKANLKNFADLVRKNASAFGGGLIKAQKQRAAVSWPAQSIALFKQSIEEHDYRAALDIGDKLGALFFVDNKGAAQMQVAPVPCDFESRLSSVCNQDGTFAVIFPQNMTSLCGASVRAKRSRAAQIENVQKAITARTNFNLSEALDKQSYSPVNQVATRAQWILEHGLSAEVIETRIVAHEIESIEAQAAQDVAQVVAQAVATIAITEAMADTSEDTRELVTCEAGESEASAPTASQTSWAPTPQYVPPSLSQIKPGAPVPPAYRGGMDDTDPPSDGNAKPTTRPVESTDDAPELDLKGFTKTDAANGFYLKDGNLTVNVSITLTGLQAQFMSGKSTPRLTVQDAVDWADALRAESARIAKLTPATPSVQKQADTPSVQKADETRKQWQGFAHDIPASLAISAYSGTSFSPERRGASAQNEYGQSMAADYETLHAQAVKGGTLDLLPEVFARYRARQSSAYKAYLASSSRCVSSFIVGPANFPAARMNKRADIAHKRLNEYLDGGQMALQSAIRQLRPDLRAIMAGDADAIDRLTVELNNAERRQVSMKAANKAIRANAKAGHAHQVTALMDLGYSEIDAMDLLNPRSSRGQGFPAFSLTNNQANIRRMRERLDQITAAKARPVETVECSNGVTLEDDAPANRVRLFFPGKPSEAIRSELKSSGFRWAPSVGAWQAYRNWRTLDTAKRMAGEAMQAEPAAPVETTPAPVAPVEIEATPPAMESTEVSAPTVAGFLEALKASDNAWENAKKASQAMEQFPRGAMGLILDSAKSTPEYQAAKREEELTIAKIKATNTYLLKNFKAEYLAHRAKKRDEKQALTPPAVESQPNSEGKRIRAAADKMRDQFPAIAAKYDDLATSHDLKDEREAQQAQNVPETPQGQQVIGKSGKWSAYLYTWHDGKPWMTFEATNGTYECNGYDTASERMKALQALARAADAPTDTPPGGGLPCPDPVAAPDPVASVAPTPTVAVSSGSPTPRVAVRRNFIPDNGQHIVDDAFEAWTFPWEDRFSFVMYLGKSAKPWKMFSYSTGAKRDDGFNRYATDARAIALSKADRKAQSKAQADKPHGLQVGDVVRSSWGYEQTNVNHYQIVKVIGKRTVEVRALAEHEEVTGAMTGRLAPVHGEFVGEVMRRQVDSLGQVNIRRAAYGRASKIEPLAIVHGVRCYAASGYSSHA